MKLIWTIKTAAEELGVSRRHLSRWLHAHEEFDHCRMRENHWKKYIFGRQHIEQLRSLLDSGLGPYGGKNTLKRRQVAA